MSEANMTTGANGSAEVLHLRDVRDMLSEKYFIVVLPSTIFQIMMSVLGVFGNSVLLSICYRRKMKNSAMLYIGFLAAVDLFACVVVIPLQIVHSRRYFSYYDKTACKLFLWFKMSTLASSCLLFMAIAVDRYKAICHPFTWRHAGRKKAAFISSMCVLVGLLAMAPELAMVGLQEYSVNQTLLKFHFDPEEKAVIDYSQPAYICEHLNSYSGSWEIATFMFIALAIFTVLVAVAIVCYTRIAWNMRNNRKQFENAAVNDANRHRRYKSEVVSQFNSSDEVRQPALSDRPKDSDRTRAGRGGSQSESDDGVSAPMSLPPGSEVVGSGNSLSGSRLQLNTLKPRPTSSHNNENRKMSVDMATAKRRQFDVARALMVVTIVFLLTWMPYWIISIHSWIFLDFHITSPKIVTSVLTFLEQLFFLNNAVNPLVYLVYSNEFRQQSKHVLRDMFRRKSAMVSSRSVH